MKTKPAIYPDHILVKDALQIYFTQHQFDQGGYNEKYFKIKLGPIAIPVINTAGRLEAVKLHDVHHLLTEYSAFWRGEVQIGGWELGSGCGKFMAAWILNFGSFGVGLLFYPRLLFKAFMMGRHVKSNLYYGYQYNEALLDRTVGELRSELEIGRVKRNTFADYFFFNLLVVLFACEIMLALFLLWELLAWIQR